MKTAEDYWYDFSNHSTGTITEAQFKAAIRKCQQDNIHPIINQIQILNRIIECIENRCMASDGPVTPTLQEITEDELASLWHTLQNISNVFRKNVLESSLRLHQ